MADDTTLIIKDIASISAAIEHFQQFKKCSGLNKTEIIPIGTNANKLITLPETLKGIQINKGPFKALNQDKAINLNFAERIKNIQKLTNIWSARHFSLKGKIMILKTLILTQVQFLL